MVAEVNVSVEKLLEQDVEEISRTGDETYRKPLTFSEELTELAQKIDFETEHNHQNEPVEEKSQEMEVDKEKNDGSFTQEQWPWQAVRNKLRTALSEVCVLLDVLQTVNMKEKKYLVLDPVSQNPEQPKPIVQMLGKKKSLAKAADVLRQGAKRMLQKEDGNYFHPTSESVLPRCDYFTELMRLRQRWRVKKTANVITGDLSYKNAGSNYWHPGLFEVKKTEACQDESVNDDVASLTVKVSSDLEGYSRVKVRIIDVSKNDEEKPIIREDSQHGSRSGVDTNVIPSWQKTLKQAQYNLFCKELFSQISREASQSNTLHSAETSGHQIHIQLFRDAYADIIYEEGLKTERRNGFVEICDGCNEGLELRLQQILHKQHTSNTDLKAPHPSTAPWIRQQSCITGLRGLFLRQNVSSRKGLLETFTKELKHVILRERTINLFDRLSTEYKDPQVIIHWSMVGSPICSTATVHITSSRREFRHRTSFHVRVQTQSYEVVCMDGTKAEIAGHSKDMEQFTAFQISRHLVQVALSCLGALGWTVLQSSKPFTCIQENPGLTVGLMARSPNDTSCLCICIDEKQSVNVIVERPYASSSNDEETLAKLIDKKWICVKGRKEHVDWSLLPGRNFVDKISNLAALIP